MKALFLVWLMLLTNTAHLFAQPPYKKMLDDPMTFTGEKDPPVDPSTLDSIAVGLFAPGLTEGFTGREIHRGVLLAMERAKKEGGYKGVPFRLVRRWDEKPWAQGSKEMVRLAYVDRVWAVIGSLSSSSNIAQQIATKAYLPVISPLSTDSTLTHARVPWTFRLAPDDQAIGRVLIREGIKARGLGRVGLVTTVDHDGRTAGMDLLALMRKEGVMPLFHFQLKGDLSEAGEAAGRIREFSPDGLLLHLPRELTEKVLLSLSALGVKCPLFLPWTPGLSGEALLPAYGGPLVVVEPFDMGAGRKALIEWTKAYTGRFDASPTFTAAYAFDAASIIVSAIRSGGLSRKGIRDSLAELSGYQGVSGPVEWDNGGSNKGKPRVRDIYSVFKDDEPVKSLK